MEHSPLSGWRSRALVLVILSGGWARAELTVEGRPVEVHAFVTEGFAKSDGNNYLTMDTSRWATDFFDGGVSVSMRLNDKLRVGAQGYVRHIGKLGEGHPTLDWASADYRFKDYFGVRAGQVKTVLGLYNDTQDLEFLHTWALLPQSLYPLDLRGLSLSHLGGDIYGSISPRRFGTFSYTAYIGKAPRDPHGGRVYALKSFGFNLDSDSGRMLGADLKWNTPVEGLLLGAAALHSRENIAITNALFAVRAQDEAKSNTVVLSAQYNRGRLQLDYERSRQLSISTLTGAHGLGPGTVTLPYDLRGWYAAAAFRVWSHLELGTYHSRFYPNADQQPLFQPFHPAEARHLYDQAITARVDVKTHFDLKVEGHFMDGYGDPGSSRGFYLQDNPQGLKPKTKLLVIRLGFNY